MSIQYWIENSGYCGSLGITFDSASDDEVILLLPYNPANANPNGALHGGVAASLASSASMALARNVLQAETGPWHSVNFSISYLAAAVGDDLIAHARLRRRGRDLVFADISIESGDGKLIAVAQSVVRGRQNKPKAVLAAACAAPVSTAPPPFADRIQANPFVAGRSMSLDVQEGDTAVMTMPGSAAIGEADGGAHEGAVLGLMDTVGAMAAWSLAGPGEHRASTPAIQAQINGPLLRTDFRAVAKVRQQDDEIYWVDVEVADTAACVVAGAAVLYRITS